MVTKEEFDHMLDKAFEFFIAFVICASMTAAVAALILMVFP